jgi:acyl-coenzyme A synthetase/AMP-(fatty) acid ligase
MAVVVSSPYCVHQLFERQARVNADTIAIDTPADDARKFRFIRLPERPAPTRLCDTGDRAVRLPDETLVWLGRADEQVKWHGFRIEPAEIEQVLLQHPAVCEAVVVAQQDQGGESHLVAFIVPSTQGPPPSSSILHAFPAQFLPSPRIPSRFITCEILPLTPSGKINRQALSDTTLGR